jgi:hypothetical protein
MKVYKRKLIGHTASGVKTYQFYRVDVTDYAFIEYVVYDPESREYALTPFVQSFITGEFEILYVRDPYHDKYMELCGITGRVLERYWKLIYRSI